MAVEFRHGSWLTDHHRDQFFKFLRENGITYVMADEPQYGSLVTVPFLPEVTTDTLIFGNCASMPCVLLSKAGGTPRLISFVALVAIMMDGGLGR